MTVHCSIMSGRGRPRKPKCADIKPPRCPQKALEEEDQTSTTGKQTIRKMTEKNHELPEHNEVEVNKKQPRTPKDATRKKSAKDCSSRSTSPTETAKEMTTQQPKGKTYARARATTISQVQPDAHKTKNHIDKGAKPKRYDRVKLPEEEEGDIMNQPPTLNDSTEDRRTIVKRHEKRAKAPAGKTQIQPEEVNEAVEFCVQGANAGMKQIFREQHEKAVTAKKANSNTLLVTTLETLKIKKRKRSEAAQVINNIQRVILEHLRGNTLCFKNVQEPLRTGSYYENLKISNPDEFDIMFPIPVERVDIEPFGEDGAFYIVSLKRGNNPLKKFQPESKPLSASEMLKEFRDEVLKSIKKFPGIEIKRKKKGCPAVTLNIKVDSRDISLDVVLCLEVTSSWPPFTNDGFQIQEWLSRKVKQIYKRKPYYLVPKYEGRGTAVNDGVLNKDAWRVSFSHVEKDIIKNHGSEKTCCEKDGVRCCRKDCLKLLKHLLHLLKTSDSSFDKFCSYHAKTTLLHACCSRTKDSQWAAASLSQCFHRLLEDFEGHLEQGQLNNFFIPAQNLLSGCNPKSCKRLAFCIRQEREEGFPIFNNYILT